MHLFPPFLTDREAIAMDTTFPVLQKEYETQRGLARAGFCWQVCGEQASKPAPKWATAEREVVTDLLRVRKEKLGHVER